MYLFIGILMCALSIHAQFAGEFFRIPPRLAAELYQVPPDLLEELSSVPLAKYIPGKYGLFIIDNHDPDEPVQEAHLRMILYSLARVYGFDQAHLLVYDRGKREGDGVRAFFGIMTKPHSYQAARIADKQIEAYGLEASIGFQIEAEDLCRLFDQYPKQAPIMFKDAPVNIRGEQWRIREEDGQVCSESVLPIACGNRIKLCYGDPTMDKDTLQKYIIMNSVFSFNCGYSCYFKEAHSGQIIFEDCKIDPEVRASYKMYH